MDRPDAWHGPYGEKTPTASVLIDLFHPRTHPDRKAKLEHLIAELQRKKIKIVIPTPALAEFLARAGKMRDASHARLSTTAAFRIAPFDSRAAMECALMLEAALTGGDKRAQEKTWAKARTLYSEDGDIARIGQRLGLAVIKTDDPPLPDSAWQAELELPE